MNATLFRQFGMSHWAVLFLTVGLSLAILSCAKRIREIRDDRWIRYGLAFLLLMNGIPNWLYSLSRGTGGLPLQLCDVALVAVIWSLLKTDRIVGEIAYFLGLAGSFQAILSPDLNHEFPSYPWFSFFINHGGVVLCAIYLLARGRLLITLGSVWRVWLLGNVYLAFIAVVNFWLGTNYMYLSRKPTHPSLLDYLGPWPYYILGGEVVALGLFFLCYALSRWVNRKY
jgi:hypothetical integral membrane protein (TIGR02206 family)